MIEAPHRTVTSKEIARTNALWLQFLLLLAFLLPSVQSIAQPQASEPAPAPSTVSSSIEAEHENLTQQYLKQIEAGLDAKVKKWEEKSFWQDGKWKEDLRQQMIHLSMWGSFGDLTAVLLEALGDNSTARKCLFLIMPLVEWMSEPFLFPVDTSLRSEAFDKEIDRIAHYISLKKQSGMGVSLDNVGDASLSEEDAKRYLDYYLQVLRAFAQRQDIDEINFSLKLSALVYQLDRLQGVKDIQAAPKEAQDKAQEIKKALVTLLRAAESEAGGKKVFVRLDMEEYACKDATIALFKEIVDENPDISGLSRGELRLGLVIQAYLRDAWKDLEDLKGWAVERRTRVPVRLVKGAYEKYEKSVASAKGDPRSPVWSYKASTDASYEDLAEYLILNKEHFRIAIATHNIRTMAHAMALAEYYGMSKSEFELQMLQGMGDAIKDIITEMGYGMRIYLPAGSLERGLKYSGRRFRELASKDNALSRTLHGDYSHLAGPSPAFQGPEDISDGARARDLVARARMAYEQSLQGSPSSL